MKYEEIKEYSRDIMQGRATKKVIQAIFDLHIKIFKKDFNISCSSCYADAWLKIYKHYKIKGMVKNCDYKLKAGAVVVTNKSGSKSMTNANISNELSEEILSENKGLIQFFEVAPTDWQRRCKLVTDEPIVEVVEEKPIEEVVEEVKEVLEVAELEEKPKPKKRTRKAK